MTPGKTELPNPFPISEPMAAWLREKYPGLMRGPVQDEHEYFCDYWWGNGKRMKDWAATWRNWMRRAHKDGKLTPEGRRRPKTFREVDAANTASRPAQIIQMRDALFGQKPKGVTDGTESLRTVGGRSASGADETKTRPRLPGVATEGGV